MMATGSHMSNISRHFCANKPKAEMRHFCLKHYKTRYTPVRRDRIPSGAPELHALFNDFGINFLWVTLTLLIVSGINFKSVIGNCFWGPISGVSKGNLYLSFPALGCAPLWDYTYTPETTLTLLNCFQINFNSVHARCIVKTSRFTRGVCKNQGF